MPTEKDIAQIAHEKLEKASARGEAAGGMLALMGLLLAALRATSIKHPIADIWFLENVLLVIVGVLLYRRGRSAS